MKNTINVKESDDYDKCHRYVVMQNADIIYVQRKQAYTTRILLILNVHSLATMGNM